VLKSKRSLYQRQVNHCEVCGGVISPEAKRCLMHSMAGKKAGWNAMRKEFNRVLKLCQKSS
jgi:hypothetical protein